MILTRRTLLGSALAAAAVALTPLRAYALSDSQASSLVEALLAEINGVIASGKAETAMISDFQQIFLRYADLPAIARYVLGPDIRRLNGAQISGFTDAFSVYVSKKYGRRFREFVGGRLELVGTFASQQGVGVRTTAYLRGEAPFEVSFLISDASGRAKFTNMSIEGVNMLLSERQEVLAMLDARGGDIARLIADLRAF